MVKVTPRQRQPRERSFGGCSICRLRKVKCDEGRPLCGQCSRAGHVCSGYEAKIRFVYYTGESVCAAVVSEEHSRHRARRVLFTDADRAAMSRAIAHEITEDEVDNVLNGLEEQIRQLDTVGILTVGPFAVFAAKSTMPADDDASRDAASCAESQAALIAGDDLDLALKSNTAYVAPSFESAAFFDPLISFDEVLSDGNLNVNHDADISIQSTPGSQDLMDNSSITPLSLSSFYFASPGGHCAQESISPNTHYLLDHYKSGMGRLFSPLRTHKAPWAMLHFPRVLTVLSELSVFKMTSHAKSSLFHGILSVSAFNLDKLRLEQTGTSNYWWAVGENFRDRAKLELGYSCNTELSGEHRAKYKDILMAILTVVTISVVSGQLDEARSFLLNAEMFICLRGVPKPNKSRKVRLLHNIYLFLRVIEESTHIYQDNACSLVSVPAPDKKTCFPSLRTHSLHAGRDLDAHCGGDFEVGLLGENAGLEYEQSPSLFEQIYGIPRILLSFISRSTWLANQIDALRTQGQGLFFTEQLEAQCRTLEDEICGWNSHTDDLLAPGDDSVAPVNQAIMPHLVTAMHRAVIIFFYRRVRRINPLLLQSHSRDAILHLEQAEQKKLGFSVANSGIVWPGFIAAAELLDAELQARAYRLLQKCARTSGLRNFDVASSCLQDLWMTRRQRGDSTISWVDHVRERKLALILT